MWPGDRGLRALIVLVVLVLPAGCRREAQPEYFGTVVPRHGPRELSINNGSEPEWIDPNRCADSSGGDIIFNTFAGLLGGHPQTLEPTYEIAYRHEADPTQTEFRFWLRPSQWSDGTPLTAHDFEWSWKRLLNPATAAKYKMMGYVLENGEIYNRGAVIVAGIPTAELDQAATTEGLIKLLPDDLRSVEIRRLQHPEVLAVLPPAEETSAARKRLIEALNQRQLGQHTIYARVAEHQLVGVRAENDHELEVRLAGPTPYFFYLLAYYPFMPVPRHVIERLEEEGINPDLWTRPEHFVSNGPYTLKHWRFRQYMDFEKNPHYWRADAVQIDRVRAYVIESYNTALNMYKAGEIDWPGSNTSIPAEFMDYLRPMRDLRRSPYLAVYFYWINTRQPPLDNVLVRRALSLAIDREKLTRYVTRGDQIPTADLVPDGLAGFRGAGRPIFDPEAARKLLDEAGYPGGQGLAPISLTYNTSEGHRQIAVAVQQMWQENLGIHVELVNQEWGVYLKNVNQMNFQIARMGWIGDYPDPNTFVDLLASQNGNNHSNWKNPEFDQLLQRANATTDPQQRLRLLEEAERMAMDQQPLIPLYVYTRTQLVKPYLRGMWENFQDRHLWQYMSIDERWYDGVPHDKLPGDELPGGELPREGVHGDQASTRDTEDRLPDLELVPR